MQYNRRSNLASPVFSMFFHARVIYQIEKTVTNNCIHCHEELIIQPQHNKSATVVLNLFHTKRLHLKEEMMMKSLYEELGGTYTLGDDGMLYPDLAIGDKDSRPIGKWGRMHMKYLDIVDNSQINVLTQRTMHRICTAATNEEVSFAYRVAIPRQRFRWRNAFSTRWRSL